MRASRGQATIELVVVLPALLVVLGGLAESVLAVWSATEAADAARAGRRALAVGADAAATARAALPDALARDALVVVGADGVRVRVLVPAVIPGLDLHVDGAAG